MIAETTGQEDCMEVTRDPSAADIGGERQELADDIGQLAARPGDGPALVRVGRAAVASARAAGAGAVASGRWLADVAVDVAVRLPVRDRATLEAQFGGLSGSALAGALIRAASRSSAGVGAAAGAVVAAEQLTPPTLMAVPAELLVETLVIAAIEMKLVAELHEVYGHHIAGGGMARGLALARAWGERRGITPEVLASPDGLAEAMGAAARHQVVRIVRRRLAARLGRNLTTLAPFLVGAAAAAEVNRRATVAVGTAVVRDLAARARLT